jgi:hypothetical protein
VSDPRWLAWLHVDAVDEPSASERLQYGGDVVVASGADAACCNDDFSGLKCLANRIGHHLWRVKHVLLQNNVSAEPLNERRDHWSVGVADLLGPWLHAGRHDLVAAGQDGNSGAAMHGELFASNHCSNAYFCRANTRAWRKHDIVHRCVGCLWMDVRASTGDRCGDLHRLASASTIGVFDWHNSVAVGRHGRAS